MSEKYDGWCIKSYHARDPWLIFDWFCTTRTEAIEQFEKLWGKGAWRKERRKGWFELVKVKLVEVE